jgi:hypothetical protein
MATTTATLTLTGLGFAVSANVTYRFKYHIIYRTTLVNTGIRLGLNFPAATVIAAVVRVGQSGADGTAFMFEGPITVDGDSVVTTTAPAVNTDYLAIVEGTIRPSGGGSLVLWHAAEASGASGITVRQGSNGILEVIGA